MRHASTPPTHRRSTVPPTPTGKPIGSLLRLALRLALALAASLALAAGALAQSPRPHVRGRALVQFRPEVTKAQARLLLAAVGARAARELTDAGVLLVVLPPHVDESAAIRALSLRPEVAFAELDQLHSPQWTPDDPYYTDQWHLVKVGAPEAWDLSPGSADTVIAILDTGVDASHPDLAGKLVPGWNVLLGNADTTDEHGHGTSVAGTAAASTNNGLGVAGVAPLCRLMPIRIAGPSGYAPTTAIADGLAWAASRGVRVANLSYNVLGSATVSNAARSFQRKGGLVVVGAGNDGLYYGVEDNPYLVAVSATELDGQPCPWSNSGTYVDLSAPGRVYSTLRGGGYGWVAGTSFSAPIVSAVAGLLLSLKPNLSAAEVLDLLQHSATDLGAAGRDATYGWGQVNALRALELAGEATGTKKPGKPRGK